ncbi:MAG: 1,4-dihydroxy-2-naphthoate octaprenyltransferase [Bacteroides sp.]|nr:1,4-dihydroxy-2-naphthoate octaprenyltransferase [Bacteroides sp.]MBD5332878.1 1,4-dihydroxy-2-naphthoate octaprenyltransferase [Bacteroides sp.]
MSTFRVWIEAMRLRTLPVSLAGVIYAGALGLLTWRFSLTPWLLALIFALLAQIASNFANEYFDFRAGLDRPGREGPRRGVTEGDISPRAMLLATILVLAAACLTGVVLVALYGAWWMYPAGVAIALGVFAYSAGPWPLSRHALGEVAVVIFFGLVPVCLTYILMAGNCPWWVTASAAGIGLMGANVLIVNNYRDADDDKAVGKHTLAVVLGRNSVSWIYLANGYLAATLTLPEWVAAAQWGWIVPCVYVVAHSSLFVQLRVRSGRRLNPLLGLTAMLMLIYTLAFAGAVLSQM